MGAVSAELQPIEVDAVSLDDYAEVAGRAAITQARALAAPLRGRRLLHLSGPGESDPELADLLRSLVGLQRDLGLKSSWVAVTSETVSAVGDAVRDGLRGAAWRLDADAWSDYLANCSELGDQLEEPDAVVVHDGHALGVVEGGRGDARWIWRCHLDASQPDADTWARTAPLVKRFDHRVFSLPGFVPSGLPAEGLHVIPAAIDPLAPANADLAPNEVGDLARKVGIDLEHPLVFSHTRADRFADPLGVIEAWDQARERVPGLQLALFCAAGPAGPEALRKKISERAKDADDLFVLNEGEGIGPAEANALSRLARCAIHNVVRGGFEPAVSEALLKRTPVVAGTTPGPAAQLRDGRDGYLVASGEECAERVAELVSDHGLAVAMGRAGREHVVSRFLVTRLLADDLRLLATPTRGRRPAAAPA
jgi:trehalose synthase